MSKKDKSKKDMKGKSAKAVDGEDSAVALAEPEQKERSSKKEKKEKKERKKHDEEASSDGKPGKVSVSFESSIPREEAVSYFETLVSGLKKGTLHLRQDTNEISLQPPAQLDVRVKASHKREKEKIEFEISWRTPSDSKLTISAE